MARSRGSTNRPRGRYVEAVDELGLSHPQIDAIKRRKSLRRVRHSLMKSILCEEAEPAERAA